MAEFMMENIFSSRVATKILLHIGRKPYKEFYLNEISKELKIGLGRTKTILEGLNKSKILLMKKSGNRLLYKLNENNDLALKIIELANLNALMELPEIYKTAINRFSKEYETMLGENLTSIVIFGSVARGKAKEWSDIDIFVIVKDDLNKKIKDKLHSIFSDVMEIFSKISQEHVYSQAKFQENYGFGDDFLINVMRDGIIIYDKNFFNKFLIKGIPNVTKKAIENRLKIAKNWLDLSIEAYKKYPDTVASQLGIISIHLSRALLLVNNVLPGSKYDIPKQLEGIGEAKFSKIYKKTRGWWEQLPLEVDKDEVWKIISFLKEKYIECSRKLEGWS